MADTITLAIDALASAAFIEGGVSIERTDEARKYTEQRKRELIEAIAAGQLQAVVVPDERVAFEQDQCTRVGRDLQELTQHENGDYDCDEVQAEWESWKARAALAAAPTELQAVPAAWMDDGSLRSGSTATAHRVVTAATKAGMPLAASESFNTPLYTASQAQPADAQWLQTQDMEALERFAETTDDDESYDIGKEAVTRLAGFGCLHSHGFGRYSITDFGHYVLSDWTHARALPFMTQAELDAKHRAAMAAAQEGGKQ